MKISILCSSAGHPINACLERWIGGHSDDHDIRLVRKAADLDEGDLLFLISCNEMITEQVRAGFSKTLVIHASALPAGRGWSPHIWQILEGKDVITVTLLEAENAVDSGDIWHQIVCHVPRHALWDEINTIVFSAELELMEFAVEHFGSCRPRQQDRTIAPTYYRKRTPADSLIDPSRSIEDQFDLIRICDPERFPAYFEYLGHKFTINIRKLDDE